MGPTLTGIKTEEKGSQFLNPQKYLPTACTSASFFMLKMNVVNEELRILYVQMHPAHIALPKKCLVANTDENFSSRINAAKINDTCCLVI